MQLLHKQPTIAEFLTGITRQFTLIDRLDAEILLSHVLGVARSYLYAWPEQVLTPAQIDHYQKLMMRRIAGEPLAYVTGHKEFWSLDLLVNPSTLIPRPETELLVEQALARLPVTSSAHILDLGTGCGAIALAIAHERPRCQVLATDCHLHALAVAQHNAQRLGIHNVVFLLSDWFAQLDGFSVNLIVSNPPYLADDDPHLQQANIRHEPQHALIAGTDGLAVIQHLVAQAQDYLEPGGWLIIEQGYQQAAAVQRLFRKQAYTAITTYFDLAGHSRVTVGQKKGS